MGGSQGALARKLAEAKKQNRDSENTTTDDVGKENVTSEEDKMRRDFEYMIKNDAYSLLADEEDEGVASVAAGGSSSSRANTPPPPKLYVGDDFPLTEAQLREYCITPSGEPSTQCGVGKVRELVYSQLGLVLDLTLSSPFPPSVQGLDNRSPSKLRVPTGSFLQRNLYLRFPA